MKKSIIFLLLMLIIATLIFADDEYYEPARWVIGVKFGGHTLNNDMFDFISPTSFATGFEITTLLTSRTAHSFSVDLFGVPGKKMAMAPVTYNFKVFPFGNSLRIDRFGRPPSFQPWFGAGAGAYVFQAYGSAEPGKDYCASLAAGAVVPIGRKYEINSELRWILAPGLRATCYYIGFGFRL